MASTINASSTANGIVSTADASGILNIQSNGVNTNAQAWVRWNYPSGGPVTIQKQYNVSSVTRASQGNYLVSFTNALSDGNYVLVSSYSISATSGTNTGAPQIFNNGSSLTAPTASSFYVNTPNYNATANLDPAYACFVVFD